MNKSKKKVTKKRRAVITTPFPTVAETAKILGVKPSAMIGTDWMDRLSPQAKAEILATVLHELSCTMRKEFEKLPRKFRTLVNHTMRDCSIWHHDLSKHDLQEMRAYWKYIEKR